MRQALQTNPEWATGMKASEIIKLHLDWDSQENLNYLFDTYPGSIVEISCFNRSLGDLRWNTLFWEVRYY